MRYNEKNKAPKRVYTERHLMEGVTQRSSSLAFLHNPADKGCM
jgi:hypothetical protein